MRGRQTSKPAKRSNEGKCDKAGDKRGKHGKKDGYLWLRSGVQGKFEKAGDKRGKHGKKDRYLKVKIWCTRKVRESWR